MDAREHRLAQNEALFREVNERVEAVASHLDPDDQYQFLCECANTDCTFKLSLSISTYEAIRADPKQFVVLPDHYTPEIEDLVVKEDAYWVVRKSGDAGEYVEHLDPRNRQVQ
jgi:AraC-like DNA-binding protein